METKYKLNFLKKGLEKSLSSASITRTHTYILAANEKLEFAGRWRKKHNQVEIELVAIVLCAQGYESAFVNDSP